MQELLSKCNQLLEKYEVLRVAFKYDLKKERLEEVTAELAQPNVWDDINRAQELGKEQATLQKILTPLDNIITTVHSTQELLELEVMESGSTELPDSVLEVYYQDILELEKEIANLELKVLFHNPHDLSNCYMEINSGAGGTEAQDWVDMLTLMYQRWCASKGFTCSVLDRLPGEQAGSKSVALFIEGEYAYGQLRLENGVHRLVRPSPFNALNKRQTSFASVYVYPEVDDDIDIEIKPEDLKIDTYRAQGAGGQHVNKTESAIRITHIPTGIVCQSQNSRSQHNNRANAMRQLKARLVELEEKKRLDERNALEASKSDVNFGAQIRSYVLDDNRVKDVRTGYESRNPDAVLQGNIDGFILAQLRDLELNRPNN